MPRQHPVVLEQLRGDTSTRLDVIWADNKYHNHRLEQWIDTEAPGSWRLEVVRRPPEAKGFVLLPKRWVVERTLAWLGRCRRHSKDYERHTASSESMLRVSAIHLMLGGKASASELDSSGLSRRTPSQIYSIVSTHAPRIQHSASWPQARWRGSVKLEGS